MPFLIREFSGWECALSDAALTARMGRHVTETQGTVQITCAGVSIPLTNT
jgi:hypothetical protein